MFRVTAIALTHIRIVMSYCPTFAWGLPREKTSIYLLFETLSNYDRYVFISTVYIEMTVEKPQNDLI